MTFSKGNNNMKRKMQIIISASAGSASVPAFSTLGQNHQLYAAINPYLFIDL
jgi:hypothetical protein